MALLTTQLYVIRHAVAEDVAADGDDYARPLTRKGRRRFARLVQRLARAGMAVDLIATSPLVRTTLRNSSIVWTGSLMRRSIQASGRGSDMAEE